MDPEEPGLFRCYGRMRDTPDDQSGMLIESFRIVVDMDSKFTYYPEVDGSNSGEAITYGPDACESNNWLISSFESNVRFEIVFDLRAETKDRRKMVQWTMMDSHRLSVQWTMMDSHR